MALKDKFLNGRGLYSLMDKIKNFVKPNQQTSGGEANLTSLEVNGTNYVVPQGTNVVANPSPAGSTALTGLQIGDTKYKVATEIVVDSQMSSTSKNPVQNKVITNAISNKQDVIDSSHKLSSDLVDDTNHTNKFVTTSEKNTWNNKQDTLVSGTNIKTINNESVLGSGNITISGGSSASNVAYEEIYNIISNVENGSLTGDTTIGSLGTAELTIVPNEPYLLPTSITVAGAEYQYDSTSGVIVLSHATQNVGLWIECLTPPATATVTGLGSQDPSDVHFMKSSNFTPEGIGIEEVTFNGDVFIKIPTMYRKVNEVIDNQITSFTMSVVSDEGFDPYPCFVAEDGTTILPYILIGKYSNTASNDMVSTTEADGVSMGLSNLRTYTRNRGSGYQQYDWMMNKLWQDLIIIFKETVNTNPGVAWTYDELGIYWGGSASYSRSGMVDGFNGFGYAGEFVISYKPSMYANEATASSVSYQSPNYNIVLSTSSGSVVKKLGYDPNHPFVNFPSEIASDNTYSTYYCDGYYCMRDSYITLSPAGNSALNGVFRFNTGLWDYGSAVGRLCYRPSVS